MVDIDPQYEESARDDVVCWFNISVGTKRSTSLELWAEDCEKMGMNWEIRQSDEKHWTVFLFLRNDWLYNKQIRSFEVMRLQEKMNREEVINEARFPKPNWEIK